MAFNADELKFIRSLGLEADSWRVTWNDDGHIVELDLHCLDNLPSRLESLRYLEKVNCWGVDLETLVISGCTNLKVLDCCACKDLAVLDLSFSPNLRELNCRLTQVNSLDLSSCSKLERLSCSRTKLDSLDLSFCPNLQELDCAYTQINSLDLSYCPNLQELDCEEVELRKLDTSCCPNLQRLYFAGVLFRRVYGVDGASSFKVCRTRSPH